MTNIKTQEKSGMRIVELLLLPIISLICVMGTITFCEVQFNFNIASIEHYMKAVIEGFGILTTSCLCLVLLPGSNEDNRKQNTIISIIIIAISILLWYKFLKMPKVYEFQYLLNSFAALINIIILIMVGKMIQLYANGKSILARIMIFLFGMVFILICQESLISNFWKY